MAAEVRAIASGVGAAFTAGAFANVGHLAFGPLGYLAIAAFVATYSYSEIKQQERDADHARQQAEITGSGIARNIRAPITTRKVIYGQRYVGDLTYTFLETTNNNRDFHAILPFASHEIEGFDAYFLNGVHVPMVDTRDRTVNPNAHNEPILTPASPHPMHGRLFITPYLGSPDQSVGGEITDQLGDTLWTSEHRGRGIAYLYVRLNFTRTAFPRGEPVISAIVRGKKLFDPRTPLAAPAWSDNAALVLRDFMTTPDDEYGLGYSPADLDEPSFIAAANRADQLIRLATRGNSTAHSEVPFQGAISPAADGYIYLETDQQYVHNGDEIILSDDNFLFNRRGFASTNGAGGFRIAPSLVNARAGANLITIPANTPVTTTRINGLQYTINALIDTATNPRQTLRSMLDAQETDFVLAGGRIRLIPPSAPVKTGAYATGGNLIEESHVVGGDFLLNPSVSINDQVNTIKGTFTSPANNWQPTDYPQFSVPQSDIDNDGRVFTTDLPLPFTISQPMAQRLSRNILNEQRHQRTITFSMDLKGLRFQIGDFIYIRKNNWDQIAGDGTVSNLFADIPFKIVHMELGETEQDGNTLYIIKITAKESPTRLPTFGVNDELPVITAPPTTLPNPAAGLIAPSSLTLESGDSTLLLNKDGTVTSILRAFWARPVTDFQLMFEIGYKPTTDNENQWRTVLLPKSSNTHDMSPVQDGVEYDVRIRSISSNGLESPYTYTRNHTIVGKTARPPTPLTPLQVTTLANGTRQFYFDISTAPADVRSAGGGALIRYSSDLSATWEQMTLVRDKFRAAPWEAQIIPEGRYRFGLKWEDGSGNESLVARFSEHTLGRQDVRETFLQRSEADLDNDWNGTLGTNTIKVVENSVTRTNQLMANTPSGTNFTSLPSTHAGEAAEWNDRVYSPRFIDYTTPVIALSTSLTFAAQVEMEYEGFVHTRTIRHSNTLTSGGALSSPQTITFEEGQSSDSITARYIQITVQVRPATVSGGQARRSAVLRDIRVDLRGDTIPHYYRGLNTATATSSTVPGFNRLAAGRFTLEHPTAGSILSANVQFQGARASTSGAEARIINKDALSGNRVGVEIRIYNQAGTLTDDTVDVEIQGTRRGVARSPVDDSS